MGYRAEWLKHEGLLSVHSEVMLHAIDRAVREGPHQLLLVGVGNGGNVEVWRKVLPEGSTVTAIDINPRVTELELSVHVCEVNAGAAVRETLKGAWFDVIIDASGQHSPHVWPFLKAGGILLYEGYEQDTMLTLVRDTVRDVDSWLPYEEIMSIVVFPEVFAVEKRNPRVVPYLDVIVGTRDPIVPEDVYQRKGAKRVKVV